MADFRVAEHHRWSEVPESATGAPASEETELDLDALLPEEEGLEARRGGRAAAWVLQVPGRFHDFLFRPLRGHRVLFASARFLLVLVAVLLIVQGVTGAADIRTQTGEDRSVTNPATVQMYLAPGSTHRYPIEVSTGVDDRISALFTNDRGAVRLPAAQQQGAAFGLHVDVTKSHSSMRVELLVAKPGESYRSAPVLSDDGDVVRFDAGRFSAPGEYGLLVRSAQGVGPAKLSITIVEAPIERVGVERLSWLPLISGSALATVLVGPYIPGAVPLAPAGALAARARASEIIVVSRSD